MKTIAKRSLAWLMTLMMCVTLFCGVWTPAQAATVNYVTSGNYVYNWGQREELATFLSPMAEAWYAKNNISYETLSALSGSSSRDSVPTSALYKELQDLMKSNHDYETSYNATRDLFCYTDCQNSGGKISSFYSGKEIGPDWDGGATWNREHTWPNSKGDASGNGENDIIMLRPTAASENSSRGNTAYGESSGFYDPNKLGNELRGDVARIMLFVYCRWGNTGSMWGASGVMESLEVLLKWVEEDPVDTWELGRNDAVEAITGTRNVFVDYPELVFVLFNAEVPAGYDSPSGEGANGSSNCKHNLLACGATCPECGTYVKQHSYKNTCVAVCENGCGTANPNYKGHIYTSNYDDTCDVCGEKRTVSLPAADSTLSIADAIAIGSAMTHNTTTSGKYYVTGTIADVSNATYGNMNIQDAEGNKLYVYGTWSADGSTRYDSMANQPTAGMTITLYGVVGNYNGPQMKNAWITDTAAGCDHVFDSDCDADCNKNCGYVREPQHNYVQQSVVAATCTQTGTATYKCSACGVTKSETLATVAHQYVNGVCSVCNAKKPTDLTPVTSAAQLVTGQYVLVVDTGYAPTHLDGTWVLCGQPAIANGVLSADDATDYLWTLTVDGSSVKLQDPNGTYIAPKGGNTNGIKSGEYSWAWTFANGKFVFAGVGEDTVYLASNTTTDATYGGFNKFRGYKAATASGDAAKYPYQFTLYTVAGSDEPDCDHEYEYDCSTVCDLCGEETRPEAAHQFDNDQDPDCNYGCGYTREVGGQLETVEATITFDANKTQRTSFSADQQVWKNGDVTFTNNKASSGNAVADYSNPVRLYQGSEVIIAGSGMTQIVIVSDGTAKYKTALEKSLSGAGYTYTNSGNNYTVALNGVDSVTFALTAQARFKSITVTYSVEQSGSGCDHSDLVCGDKCSDCGYTKEHNYPYACSTECKNGCGIANPNVVPHTYNNAFETVCSVCKGGARVVAPEVIVDAAYALSTGASLSGTYTLTGVITSVDTAYNASYSNVTVTMAVLDSEGNRIENKPIQCYRLQGNGADQIAVGYTITVTGIIKNYNGKIEFDAGCTLNNYSAPAACVEHKYTSDYDADCNQCGEVREVVLPVDPAELVNAAYALAPSEYFREAVTLTGIISEAETYDESYGNITVIIDVLDANGNLIQGKPIKCYRLKGDGADEIAVGYTITVTGTIKNYNNEIEFDAGCTLDSYSAPSEDECQHEDSYWPHECQPGYCNDCESELPAKADHTYVEVETLAPTCDKAGVATLTCACGATNGTVEIPATGEHTPGAAADCENAQTCTVCGTELATALGHKWNDATCTVAKTCSVCGKTEGEALDHTPGAAADCENAQTCTVCGAELATALGHKWNDATCTVAKTCSVCGKTEGEALGHTPGAAADCENAQKCTVCGAELATALGHKWNDATCTEAKTCSVCGKTEGTALGHTPGAAADCENAQKCTVCGAELATALGHKWNDATCTVAKTCSVCGKTEGTALGHTPGAAADCENAQKCTVCGAELATALGHKWNDATCTVAKTCSVCGKTEGTALGHTPGAAADCENAQKCTVCGTELATALGHKWNDATCTVAKTCSVCGKTEGTALGHTPGAAADCENAQKCTVCGAELATALGHKWNDATCTEAKTCSVCGKTEGTALGHTPGAAADCENAQKCTVCGAELATALGHKWNDATCTEAKTCSVCGKTEGTALGHTPGAAADCENAQKCTVCGAELATALGHKWNDATCTEAKTCSVCGKTEGTALGHKYVGEVTTEATCGADGVKTFTCSACGDKYTEAIPATGEHTYDNACDADCNVCAATRIPSDHHYTDEVTTAPTCTSDGVRTYTCTSCGDSYTEVIVGGHIYDNAYDADCNVCGETREVTVTVRGDADGDGKLNMKDAGIFQQYLNGWDVSVYDNTADMNSDGKLNNMDLVMLIRLLAGWNV